MAMVTTDDHVNTRAVMARSGLDRTSVSKYEFLQQLEYGREVNGTEPEYLKRKGAKLLADGKALVPAQAANEEIEKVQRETERGPPFTWMTRRRRDGKLFLARQFVDSDQVIDDAKESLLRLLNHPNLVSLVDVIRDTDIVGGSVDYMVWEYCDKGTLNRLLWHGPGKQQVVIPESLCWHVLDGISQALLWLHYGHKDTFPFDQHMGHDDDWHSILIADIGPKNIFFCAPEGNETYGDVKLGCFGSASVTQTPQHGYVIPKKGDGVKYQPPEVRNNLEPWSMAAEIWSLGAILYHMMVGRPSIDTEKVMSTLAPDGATKTDIHLQPLPKRYSSGLRTIVAQMLRADIKRRPTAADLSVSVDRGIRIWRESVPEGMLYVERRAQRGQRVAFG
ncbi:MAG: hypothetical protein M1830_003176 [Pleopsidium flavum]|nr:MAG: hypothetical protein M1830_003176 [Pleopsidium flavum]